MLRYQPNGKQTSPQWTLPPISGNLYYMIPTNKIFLTDPYKKELDVTIVAIKDVKNYKALIFDITIFYPEGGGPKGDRGYIEDSIIFDTQYNKEGEILHLVDPSCSLEIGKTYHTSLDWEHRYLYMKQHTAQHLISGILYNRFAIDTLSVHLSDTYIAIETGESFIDIQTIYQIEDAVNRAIIHGGATHTNTIGQEDVASLELRRGVKVDGDVRIVTIEGYDEIACGGVHLANISEISEVMYYSMETIRGHVRLMFLVSSIAKQEVRDQTEITHSLKKLLSVPSEHIVERVQEMMSEIVSLKRELHLFQQSRIDTLIMPLLTDSEIPLIMLDLSEYDFDALKALSHTLLGVERVVLCAIKERDENSMNYLICIKGIKDELSLYKKIKMNVLDSIDAKGGGKAPLWQGIASHNKEVLAKVEKVCRDALYE